MNDRDAILQDLRRSAPPLSPLPEYPAALTYENPEAQFARNLHLGGRNVLSRRKPCCTRRRA